MTRRYKVPRPVRQPLAARLITSWQPMGARIIASGTATTPCPSSSHSDCLHALAQALPGYGRAQPRAGFCISFLLLSLLVARILKQALSLSLSPSFPLSLSLSLFLPLILIIFIISIFIIVVACICVSPSLFCYVHVCVGVYVCIALFVFSS